MELDIKTAAITAQALQSRFHSVVITNDLTVIAKGEQGPIRCKDMTPYYAYLRKGKEDKYVAN